jgi:hypothetical protein
MKMEVGEVAPNGIWSLIDGWSTRAIKFCVFVCPVSGSPRLSGWPADLEAAANRFVPIVRGFAPSQTDPGLHRSERVGHFLFIEEGT